MEALALNTDQTMSSKDIAELTGKRHAHVLRDIDNILKEINPIFGYGFKTATYTDYNNRSYRMFELDKDSTFCLMTGYNVDARMRVIKRWQELEQKEVAQPAIESSKKEAFELEMIGAEYASKILRISDSSKLDKMHLVYKSNGVPTTFLPEYTEKVRTVCSATHLLKLNNCELKTRAFNKLLIEHGYLEQKERFASKGKMKKYNSITEKGLKYGQNDAFKGSSTETQAHYYEDTFMELYERTC